jgi:hypothetical protein
MDENPRQMVNAGSSRLSPSSRDVSLRQALQPARKSPSLGLSAPDLALVTYIKKLGSPWLIEAMDFTGVCSGRPKIYGLPNVQPIPELAP